MKQHMENFYHYYLIFWHYQNHKFLFYDSYPLKYFLILNHDERYFFLPIFLNLKKFNMLFFWHQLILSFSQVSNFFKYMPLNPYLKIQIPYFKPNFHFQIYCKKFLSFLHKKDYLKFRGEFLLLLIIINPLF